MANASASTRWRFVLIGCLVCVVLPVLWLVVTMLRVPGNSVSVYTAIIARDAQGSPDASVPVLVTVNGKLPGRRVDGHSFVYLWLQPGRNTIRCTAPGYQTCTKIVEIDPTKNWEYYESCELVRSP